MKASSNGRSRLRFGQFELDRSEEKLLRRGLPIRLENQPLEILATLLEQPGELVSREELYGRLWPDGTHVDFDEGLNTAIKRLRFALGDSADNPVFIETVPRRGYRFIAPVQKAEAANGLLETVSPVNGDPPHALVEPRPELPVVAPPVARAKWRNARLIAVGIVLLGACWILYRAVFSSTLRVTQITRLTTSGRLDPWGRISSDGSRLFFLEREGDHWNTRQISVAGGESMPFGPTGQNLKIFAVSPDQSEILFAPFTLRTDQLPLWSMPLVGGAPRRVGDLVVNDAVFSRDGTRIAFANPSGVFLANRDGSGVRQLAALPDCGGIGWSPDGTLLRFNSNGSHLWQVSSTGSNLHPFLPSWTAWDGRWTSDGSYYLFTSSKDGHGELWAVRESQSIPWLQPSPTQLTFPPMNLGGALPSRDGHTIYVSGGLNEQLDVVRFDPASHQFKPALPGISAMEVDYSPDHQWVLYNDWKELWRTRPDGSDRLQLAGPPSYVGIHFARWSPDSKQIVFDNIVAGDQAGSYLTSVDGGTPKRLLPRDLPGSGPAWSPDGKTISFTVAREGGEVSRVEPGVYLFDVTQGRSTRIPGSEGLAGSSWSPDGRFVAAVSEDTSTMKLLDLRTHGWSEVAHGKVITFPVWSADSVLYFEDLLAPGEAVYRFQPGSSGPQRAYSFEDILQSGGHRCAFVGFAPDGSLLVQVSRGGGDVYALTTNLP